MFCATRALAMLLQLQALAEGYTADAAACPKAAKHCFGVQIFVVIDHGEPTQDPAWWAGELKHANKLFAPADVGFELAAVKFIGAKWAHVHARLDRDRLGRRERTKGLVHVFGVRQLDDVDIEGNLLYGVHWRDRARKGNRWIILSSRDKNSTVLAHEMGHYFGLPHSTYTVSIMNKKPRPEPRWPDRVFAAPEIERVKRRRDEMLLSSFLVERPRKK